ncbi:MAG: TIGR04086 family membrane protein [Clostridium butyricum]|nr:TIGR04086 family membrane protein [Clostridium butyricum]
MEKSKYLKSVCKGTIGSILLSLMGIVILSGMMTKFVFSEGTFNMLYVVISLIALSIGAIIGAKKNETKGWLVGFGVAIGYYLGLFILSSLLDGEVSFRLFELAKLSIAIVIGTLAGMLGINL